MAPTLFRYPDFLDRLRRRYGDTVFFRVPRARVCVVFAADRILEVLEDDGRRFGLGPILASRLPQVPVGVARTNQEEHRWRTELMAPAFAANRIAHHADALLENALRMREGWRHGDVVDVRKDMMRLLTGALLQAALGRATNADIDVAMALRPAVKWSLFVGSFPFSDFVEKLPLPRNASSRRALKRFDDLLYDVVRRARRGDADSRAMVSHFARSRGRSGNERPFTDEEIRDELCLLLLGGIGPAAHVLTWAVDHLAWNPAARARLEKEVDAVTGGQPPTAEVYDRLTWTRAVLDEVLRLAPPAYVVDRAASRDVVLDGYLVPKGTIVNPCVGLLHRNGEFFEKPLEFRPERWLDGIDDRAKRIWLPWGTGRKVCMGRHFAARLCVYALATIAQRWRLVPVSKRPAAPAFPLGPFGGPFSVRGTLRATVKRRG